MRIVEFMAGLLLILPSTGFSQNQQVSTAKPAIFCAEPKYDFGKIYQGKKVEHEFVIENKGASTLNVMSVQPSCGCTTAPISQNVVEPGKTATIKAIFDSSRFEGAVHKTITVSSNDPNHPALTLELTGMIVKMYEAIPPFINFQRIKKNSSFETQITVQGNEGRKPNITSVSFDNDLPFEATFAKKPDSEDYIITVKLKSGIEPRFASGSLIIALQDADLPKLQIPVNGQITGDISVFPPKITFGTVKPKDMLKKILITLDNPDVSVASVDVEPPILTTTTTTRQGGMKMLEIQPQVKESAPVGPVKGTINIHTTSKEQALVTVPFEGVIAEH